MQLSGKAEGLANSGLQCESVATVAFRGGGRPPPIHTVPNINTSVKGRGGRDWGSATNVSCGRIERARKLQFGAARGIADTYGR